MKKNLYQNLNIDLNKKEVISFVGGGGKTTTMFTLANELRSLGKSVLITTTTKIFLPEEKYYDNFFLNNIDSTKIKQGTISLYGEVIENNKIIGVNLLNLEKLIESDLFDFYLIEADGAKHKPIKASNDYEPIITISTTKTIGIIGLDALHKNILQTSHRGEILLEILGKSSTDHIEINDLVILTIDKKGLFKNSSGEKILILNKANSKVLIEEAKIVRGKLKAQHYDHVIIADILSKSFY